LAAAAALLAGCLWLVATWGDRVSEARATLPPPPAPPEVAEEPVPETPFAYDVVVETNLFAPSRRPPERPWSESLGTGGADPAPSASAVPAGPPPWRQYRLLGTVVTGAPATTVALIETDPASPGAERYRAGERIGPYRLRRILPTRVVLSGGIALELAPDTLPRPAAGPPEE
ncbi:MAG: hypothetical protein ACREMD_12010, partial [Gemmatimonadota bacterium]